MSGLQRLLSAGELADLLGVPVATIYAWRYRGEGPPSLRVGRHLRFRRGDVEDWIADRLDEAVARRRRAAPPLPARAPQAGRRS